MRRLAPFIVVIALLAGFVGGSAIDRYVERSLFDVLNDEVKKSTSCQLVRRGWDISPLTLSAKATNTSIECSDGSVPLQIPLMTARFSLREIFQRKIIITKLMIAGGSVTGLFPGSPAYDFILSLSTPSHQQAASLPKLKVILKKLVVQGPKLYHHVGSRLLTIHDSELVLTRDDQDIVRLQPILTGVSLSGTPQISFDTISATIVSDDETTTVKTLAARGVSGSLDGTLTAELLGDEKISASAQLSLLLHSISTTLKGEMHSNLNFTTTINESSVVLNTSNRSDTINLEKSPVALAPASGEVSIAFGKEVTMNAPRISFAGSSIQLNNLEISSNHQTLIGESSIEIQKLSALGASIHRAKGIFSVSGTIDDPQLSLKATINELTTPIQTFPEVTVNASASSAGHTYSIETSNQTLMVKGDQHLISIQASSLPLAGAIFSGSGSISNVLESPSIKASFSAKHEPLPLLIITAQGPLDATKIEVQATGLNGSIKKQGNIWDVSLKAKNFLINHCQSLSGELSYRTTVDAIRTGNGSISNLQFFPDCNTEPLQFAPSTPLPIVKGVLSLSGRSLKALRTNVSLAGELSWSEGYQLSAAGLIDLRSLGASLGSIDEFDGSLSVNATLHGPLASPELNGTAQIINGSVESESLNLAVSEINGTASLKGDTIVAENFLARVNGGDARVDGILPLNPEKPASATIQFASVDLEPTQDISLVLSGVLTVQPNPLLISGAVTIDSGEVRKNVNIKGIIANTLEGMFKKEIAFSKQSTSPFPLSISLAIPSSLSVQTNVFEADLDGTLTITGTSASPDIKGNISIVNGWLGLRGRRFDLNFGELQFLGEASEPRISLLGESTFLPSGQDAVSIVLDVAGPLSAPRVSLSSDRNLSAKELLSIVTGGQSQSELTEINGRISNLDHAEELSLDDTIPFLRLPKFLRNVTRIDSLSIDPRYDPYTLQYEPVVTARKKITDKTDLVGESLWQGTKNSAGIKLVYNLFPRFNLVALARSVPTERQTVFGIDATWTLLARRLPRLRLEPQGNSVFDRTQIETALGLTAQSMIRESSIPELKRKLLNAYRDEAYFDASAEFVCKESEGEFCRTLIITITEGKRSIVSELVINSEVLPPTITPPTVDEGVPAKETLRREVVDALTRSLRNEGFLATRIKHGFECYDQRCRLDLHVDPGKPITFIFQGNTVFTPEDFLQSIRLFTRKQPFGANTASILQENIEAMYRTRGFPFVHVMRERTEDDSARIYHRFTIVEGAAPLISSVRIEGVSFTEEELNTLLSDTEQAAGKKIISLSSPREETLNEAQSLLEKACERAGLLSVTVDRSIAQLDDNSIEVIFTVTSTEKYIADTFDVVGFPGERPSLPMLPLSKTMLEGYRQTLVEALADEGYHQALVSEVVYDNTKASITVAAGAPTKVSKITIVGLQGVKERTIAKALKLTAGDIMTARAIRETQLALMKEGLFQSVRVTTERSSGELKIEIEEKPLTTLEVGGGYSSGLGLHLFGEGSDKSLFADGRTLSLRLDGYVDSWNGALGQGIMTARFSDPSLFASPFGFSSEASLQRQELSTYEFDLNRVSLGNFFYRNWDEGLSASMGYTALQEDLKNVSPDVIRSPLDSGNVSLGYISGSTSYDTRDYPLNPTSGMITSLDSMFSDRGLGSDASYSGAAARFTSYLSLTDRFTFVSGGQFGKRWTFGSTDFVPISQRYYLGGRGSVRGYKENALGPRGDENGVIGGDTISRVNAELQYRLEENVSLQTFFDTGKLTLQNYESEFEGWNKGIGVGVRYLSPIGPIGLDFSHALDDVPGSRNFRMTFDIGASF